MQTYTKTGCWLLELIDLQNASAFFSVVTLSPFFSVEN